MAFIDSSVRSPRRPREEEPDDGDLGETYEDDVAIPEREPKSYSLKKLLVERIGDVNIAREIDQQTLDKIGIAVVEEFEIDENSRAEWADNARKAMDMAMQKVTPKNYPWAGASNVIFPLITQAALQFSATTLPAIIQGRNVVKGIVLGDDNGIPATHDGSADGPPILAGADPSTPPGPTWIVAPGEKRMRADRVGDHMSWQLLDEMNEWKPELDSALMQAPVIGGFLRKTFYEPAEGRNYSQFVSLMNCVWDYKATSFEAAPRHSESLARYPHEILSYEATDPDENGNGMWLHLDYGPADSGEGTSDVDREQGVHSGADPDAPHDFIEQCRRWDLDDDGYPEPYVVTVHRRSSQVVRIVARYDEDGIVETPKGLIQRIEPVRHYTLFPFLPSMDGGSYPMGFGHVLRHLNEAISSTTNQMLDAGHLANTGSGFVDSQATVASGEILFQVGKFARLKGGVGKSIKDSFALIPFPGPNASLFQLLGFLVSAGEKMASVQEIMTGDANIANAPPTTVLALIEQGMKMNNAIQTRMFWSLGEEFQKLFALNEKHLGKSRYRVGDEWRDISSDDYRLSGGVEPVADPTQTTDMQKLGRAALIKETCWENPIFDQQKVAIRILEAGNVDRIQDLIAPPDQTAQQMAMAKAQAEIGRERAAEQKDLTQAFLNMAQAREHANAQQQAQIDTQLEDMRLQIEAVNARTRADAIAHAFHKTALEHGRGMADLGMRAAEAAAGGAEAAPTPGPTGPFPTNAGAQSIAPPPGPTPPPGPRQPPSDNSTLPPLPAPGQDNPLAGAPPVPPPAGRPPTP